MSYLAPSCRLIFGATNIAASKDTRFIPPGIYNGTAPTTSDFGINIGFGFVNNIRIRHNAAVGNGQPVVYNIRINNVPSSLSLSLATGVIGSVFNSDPRIVIPENALLEVTAMKPASIGNGNLNVTVLLEFRFPSCVA